MANSSNKNFPHAYGAGRVIAAFSLSHPGGTVGNTEGEYLEGAEDMLVRPPAFTDGALPGLFPYPPESVSPSGYAWTPNRQPYNATSLGVYVTGSGTRRLPYRDALGLEVPSAVSTSLNRSWPSNGVYPFSLVDETQIGSTHAQVVCAVRAGEGDALDKTAYYEVGLNWDLPPYVITTDLGAGGGADNFANNAIASFRRSLARTFWATASLNSDALSEAHPEVNWTDGPVDQNIRGGPVVGALAAIIPDGNSAYAAPYSDEFGSVLQPSEYPVGVGVDVEFFQQPAVVQTQVSAIVTNLDFRVSGTTLTLSFRPVPVVRVWLQVPSEPPSGPDAPVLSPRPLPRFGLNPYQQGGGVALEGSLPPAINVQVMQKNSSAPDGTDTAVFDLFEDWETLGGPSGSRRFPSRSTTRREPLAERMERVRRINKEKA